jgi:hypothetical protein
MASLRKQIVDAVIDALNVATPTGLPLASRLRQSQFDHGDQPALAVYPGDETRRPATNRVSPLVVRDLQIHVEIRVKGDAPDVLLDPYEVWVEKALTSAISTLWHDDIQLVLLHHEYTIGTQPQGLARFTFHVPYQTRRNDPEAAA